MVQRSLRERSTEEDSLIVPLLYAHSPPFTALSRALEGLSRQPDNVRKRTIALVDQDAPRPQNRLLAGLPAADFERVRGALGDVELRLGDSIYESGVEIRHLYFPTSGIVSLLQVMENGSSAELAVVGSEGVIGIAMFMGGGGVTPSRAIVQSTGHAYRLASDALMKEFVRGGELQHLLLRYTGALVVQMAQTAVCNRHHSVEQQLCRWLLMSLDRLPSNELVMTQEMIANMLGVRREGVTEAAGKLQERNLIRYARGRITVLDRPKLEKVVCECYEVVQQEYARLQIPPRRAPN
jgi:CRP-like cAMP-binding protein